jgi:hypothetical protein
MSDEQPTFSIEPTPQEEAEAERIFQVCSVAAAIKRQLNETWPELSVYNGYDHVAMDKADTPEIDMAAQAASLNLCGALTQAYFANEPKVEDDESNGS